METTKKFKINGMHCTNCEKLIEKSVHGMEGVSKIKADYVKSEGEVVFDSEKTNTENIFKSIEENGYECSIIEPVQNSNQNNSDQISKVETSTVNTNNIPSSRVKDEKFNSFMGISFGIIGILLIAYFMMKIYNGVNLPEISQNMGYGLLFLVGLLTGFHCIAMCGSFVVGYTAKNAGEGKKSYTSHFAYGTGKTLSYTIIGAAFGLFGSIIAFTPTIRGAAGIIAGIFLVIFGINMLNLFPGLRKIRIKMPSFVNKFVGEHSKKNTSPFVIGLLNGLMIACGPLQAIYIMAAGTGSMIEGAKMLFIFGLGTLPVMLGFGFLTSFISAKATHKILKFSGVIVILLGIIMINRGLSLAGALDANAILSTISPNTGINNNAANVNVENGYQIIRMDVTSSGWTPDKFVLKKDVPVKWIITGKEITGCNKQIIVPKYNLKFDIKKGEQTIEFTPTEEGVVSWSCWMGMIRGTFIVKSDIDINNPEQVQKELASVPAPAGGSCGGGGGGCGCGMMN